MNSIMKFLFCSDLAFPSSRKEDVTFGTLSETVQTLSEQLHSAQPELWETYLKQAETLRDQERQIEFERGFLMASQLMAEVIEKMSEG